MHEPDKTIDRTSAPPGSPTNYRLAIVVSVLFHVVLIGVLLFWYLPTPKSSSDGNEVATNSSRDRGGSGELTPSATRPPPPIAQPNVPAEQIEASIESQIRSVEALPDERKLSELEKNLSRLQGIASEESVGDVTETIANSLGLEPGAVPAAQTSDGAFDPETAQIHEVNRVRTESGQWKYTSVLVDAQGRTQTVPLSAAEGETVYRTFEQLKRYPMAEGIYRQLVMPMIQKMIQASELTEQAAREAEQLRRESNESSADSDQS